MSQTVKLTQEQIDFIMKSTAIPSKNEAIEYFVSLMVKERIDPMKLAVYVSRMMAKVKK